ncbi:MAG TPA: NAD(P)-binding protein, partial [Chthoniobacter sp.]|nr:NAD(P)-binding protein [Chthoniobacter sp.]
MAVLGSGVAGAVIARRLHDFGFEVAVYEQQPIAALRKPEISVAPQFLETLSAAGFPRMVHSLAPRQTESVQLLWGSLTPRSQPHRLWHFERRTFESALRETLAGCGIPMHAAVSGVTAADFGARYLVDATGRRSTRVQPVRLAASLLGISSIWRPLAGPPEIPYLEANDHSWTWASPRSDGAVQVTVFGSPR